MYVVNIPKGETAHQAKDKRYYKRYNFESVAMEDYEIKDILNRAKTPSISIFVKKIIFKGKLSLLVYLENKSQVIAKYVKFSLEFPEGFIRENANDNITKIKKDGNVLVIFEGMNTSRDILEEKTNDIIPKIKYGPSYFIPVLSESTAIYKAFEISDIIFDHNYSILWTAQADNGSLSNGEIKINDIQFVDWEFE